MERRWESIVPFLKEFQDYLGPRVPELEIQFGNDRRWSDERYEEQVRTGIFEQYGVYLIFEADEALQYVGLAMNRFQERIWMHDAYVNRQFTDLIPFRYEHYFLAPALEFFLVCRLRPPKNKVYRDYTIPPWQLDGPTPGGSRA